MIGGSRDLGFGARDQDPGVAGFLGLKTVVDFDMLSYVYMRICSPLGARSLKNWTHSPTARAPGCETAVADSADD